MTRTVRLVRQYYDKDNNLKLGDRSPELPASLQTDEKPAKSLVLVTWPTPGYITPFEFVAITGLQKGKPRNKWRLHPDDVAAFCEQLGVRPKGRVLPELKGRKKKLKVPAPDPRQESLFEEQ